jgi:transcriptional regulator with XRE-family HTH domain
MEQRYKISCHSVNKDFGLTVYKRGCSLMHMELSERIKLARNGAGLSQAELAEKANVKQQTISQLETGKADSCAGINRIAIACGVNPLWLSDEIGEMKEKARTFSPQTLAIAEMVEPMDDEGKRAVQEGVEKEKLYREHRKPSPGSERRAG